MKALVKTHAGPGLELLDVPMPEVGPNDVLITIHKTAICGPDLHIWKWDAWAERTPPVGIHVGHESIGIIYSLDTTATGYALSHILSSSRHLV